MLQNIDEYKILCYNALAKVVRNMKTYSVKEISEMLKTNPETVRRWIRDKKLDATIESKKGGHMVSEAALQTFLQTAPKYAAKASALLANTVVFSTAMIGGMIAQRVIDLEQLKNARISTADITRYLRSEISSREEIILEKEKAIKKLQDEILAEKKRIEEFQVLAGGLDDVEEESKDG